MDYRALTGAAAETEGTLFPEKGEGSFVLYRIGDAVASRNIHAAIYDSLRLCKNF